MPNESRPISWPPRGETNRKFENFAVADIDCQRALGRNSMHYLPPCRPARIVELRGDKESAAELPKMLDSCARPSAPINKNDLRKNMTQISKVSFALTIDAYTCYDIDLHLSK
jgi:hypothetical protein